jgi:hypothetical protein
MQIFTRTRPVLVAMLVACAGIPTTAQSEEEGRAAAEAARKRLGENWIVEPEPLPGGERVLPGVRSFTCRLRARGGFPFAKMLVSADGKELACSETRELFDRAKAARIRIAVSDGQARVVDPGGAERTGLEDTLRMALRRLGTAVRDPGIALTASLALVTAVTVKGEFESATVTRTEGGGLEVRIIWKQGTVWWGFVEQAEWTLRYAPSGALYGLEKIQKSHERHPRR